MDQTPNFAVPRAGWFGAAKRCGAELNSSRARRAYPVPLYVLATVALMLMGISSARSAGLPAQFIQPIDGTLDFDPAQSIQWTAQSGALAYYLYVGSSPGLKDIVDSRETLATEFAASALPQGRVLYARIHTKYSDGWVRSDASFTVRPVAVFTSPRSNGSVISPETRFEWTAIEGAQAYYLYVGTSPGEKDLVNTGELQETSYSVANLPIDRTVYARLHTKFGGVWRSVDLALNVLPVATFSSPVAGAQDVDPRATISWRAVQGAQAYYLYVGTQPGMKDLVDSRETLATSWPATHIPAGEIVYARLHTKFAGVWRSVDISFKLSPRAVFIEPQSDGAEVDPRAPLMWTSVPRAQAYYLYVGSAPGGKDIVNTGETQALSYDVRRLPRAKTLYARLHTKADGVWRSVDLTFRLRPVATLLDPVDGESEVDTRQPVRWTAVDGAEAYYLYVGSAAGKKDLLDSREIRATEFRMDTLPAGRVVYVRLHTKHGGVWRYVETSIRTKGVAYLDNAAVNSGLFSPDQAFTWQPYAGATKYYVYVGTGVGLKDIHSSGETIATEFRIPPHRAQVVASDQTVYVRLYSLVDGKWQFVDYQFLWRAKALLISPADLAENVYVTTQRISWTTVEGATRYFLQIGSALGGKDVLETGYITDSQYIAKTLPGGRLLHARIWTEVGGEWRYADSTFSTRPAAAFTHPYHGQIGTPPAQSIAWTSIDGADAYRVEFGTSPGQTDLYSSGLLSGTSISAPALPTVGVIYGRVWTRRDGQWRFSDAMFTMESAVAPPTILWESAPSAFRARDAFRWASAPLAAAYRLRVGSTAGASDLGDSGLIRTTRRFVDGLPTGVLLYGTLDTEFIDGSSASQQFSFTVVDGDIEFEDRWSQALWLTAEVRGMAGSNNVPFPNTPLLTAVRNQLRDSAYCTAYTAALLSVFGDINIGIDARRLDVCLNTNQYDCHTLVEVMNPQLNRWVILDPTFGLTAVRSVDRESASAMDIFSATRDQNFGSIEYVPVTTDGFAFALSYYADYPLLYARVYEPPEFRPALRASVESTFPYYDVLGTTTVTGRALYALRCMAGQEVIKFRVGGSSLDIDENGVASLACGPAPEYVTHLFFATSIEPDLDDAYEIMVLRRYVFK